MTYYTFYTVDNCQCGKVFYNSTISDILGYFREQGINDYMVFNKDTWNTSERDGLCAYGDGCNYWVNQE